jgi:hypothetical protein
MTSSIKAALLARNSASFCRFLLGTFDGPIQQLQGKLRPPLQKSLYGPV